ncbi:hypothetical protein WJX82_007905 [Trebouxia sp. C0006]
MEAPHTPSDSHPEASTNPLSTTRDCKEYLHALPQGRQAMKYAVNQAQQSVRLQAAKAAEHVEICVQRNLRILDGSRSSTSERSKAAIALENCVMAAIHSQVFDNIAQIHKAEDTALHAFLEQLMAGQYDLYGTSPNLHVQDSDEAITEAVGKVRRSDKSVGPLSSDSLLPLFIVAIVVAQPLHLHACLAYVRTFHKHADWAGQTGFQVATLEAAITFLQQLLPGRSMTRGTACNPPEMLRALSMERSKSGKLLDQESLYTAIARQQRRQYQQRQQEQHEQQQAFLGDMERTSLLDVESDLPVTFALDTQMLPLQAVSRSDSTWSSRILEFLVYGS